MDSLSFDNQKRIEDLEIRLTHLEDFLHKLDQAVLSYSREQESLRKEQNLIKRRLEDLLEEKEDQGFKEDSPPHYRSR